MLLFILSAPLSAKEVLYVVDTLDRSGVALVLNQDDFYITKNLGNGDVKHLFNPQMNYSPYVGGSSSVLSIRYRCRCSPQPCLPHHPCRIAAWIPWPSVFYFVGDGHVSGPYGVCIDSARKGLEIVLKGYALSYKCIFFNVKETQEYSFDKNVLIHMCSLSGQYLDASGEGYFKISAITPAAYKTTKNYRPTMILLSFSRMEAEASEFFSKIEKGFVLIVSSENKPAVQKALSKYFSAKKSSLKPAKKDH